MPGACLIYKNITILFSEIQIAEDGHLQYASLHVYILKVQSSKISLKRKGGNPQRHFGLDGNGSVTKVLGKDVATCTC